MRLGIGALALSAAALATLASISVAQDPLEFAKLKDFKAERSSSSSPDPASNNDCKHPIGPAASAALPVLKDIAAKPIPHVGGVIDLTPAWAASRAIRKIQGAPAG